MQDIAEANLLFDFGEKNQGSKLTPVQPGSSQVMMGAHCFCPSCFRFQHRSDYIYKTKVKLCNILQKLEEEFLPDAAEFLPLFFFPASYLKGGGRMSNLQYEIRGDMVEVAGRRGSVAGKSETQKISAPWCEKLILRTHPEDVVFSKLFAAYLARSTFCS